MNGPVYADISACARCNGAHSNLEFRPLRIPVKVPVANDTLWRTHWASCPETGEPVVIRAVVTHDGATGGL